jgi:hypothetical protein
MKIQEKAIVVKIMAGLWGARKTDKEASVRATQQENADEGSAAVVKRLIARSHLKDIVKLESQIDTIMERYTLPWLNGGYRILPSQFYGEWRKEVNTIKDQYEIAVRKFLQAYPTIVQSESGSLGNMYKPEDYPTVSRLEKQFTFKIQVMPISTENDFRVKVNNDEMDEMKQDLKKQIEESISLSLKDAWNRLYDNVKRIAERLKEDNPKFKDSLIENVQRLCDILPVLNVSENKELDKMVKEIQKSLEDKNAFSLRGDCERAIQDRTELQKETEDICKRMESYI